MAIRRPLPRELMEYAGNLYPDLKANPAFALMSEDDDIAASEDMVQAQQGAANLEEMLNQNVQDTAEYERTLQEIQQGGPLEPLGIDEEAEQVEREASEMENIQARSPQLEEAEMEVDEEPQPQEVEDAEIQEEESLIERAPSYESRVMKAVKEQQKKEDMYDIWEAAGSIGKKANTKMFDKMRKRAGRPVENLLLENQLEQQKIKRDVENIELAQQIENSKAKNNPDSEISKFTRQSLIKLGMKSLEDFPNVSYSQLKELYPSLIQLLYTQISAQARVSAAAMSAKVQQQKTLQDMEKFKKDQEFKNRELQQRKEIAEVQANLKKQGIEVNKKIKDEAAETNRQNREFTRNTTLDNQATKKVNKFMMDEDYIVYSKASESVEELGDLIARKKAGEKVKIPEGAGFFKYAKIAQGDSSVLRESDIKNLAGGTDFTGFKVYLEKLQAKLRGEQFTVKDLEEMQKVVQAVKNRKKTTVYNRHVKPLKTWSDKNKFDLEGNISSNILNEFEPQNSDPEKRKRRIEELTSKARGSNTGKNITQE